MLIYVSELCPCAVLGVKACTKFTKKLRLVYLMTYAHYIKPVLAKDGQNNSDVNLFIISLTCSWIKRLNSCTCNSNKPWVNMFFAVNGKNSLVHLYAFGDIFLQQYLLFLGKMC